MASVKYAENYLVTKKLYQRTAVYHKDTLDVADPASTQELAYQSMLSEANQNYFNREYSIALERYLELRHLILVQSHPEMPVLPGGGWKIPFNEISKISIEPLMEIGRKYIEKADPVGPVINPLTITHVNLAGEFAANPALAKFKSIGLEYNNKNTRILRTGIQDSAFSNVQSGNHGNGRKQYKEQQENALQESDINLAEAEVVVPNQMVGIFTDAGVKTVQIAKAQYQTDIKNIYTERVSATAISALDFYEEIETNFVAYIPHLFFFILPVAIGDTYLAMGMYGKAEQEYLEAAKYTYLNHGIEAPYLWQKLANNNLRWGDELFRMEKPTQAKTKYEKIITGAPSVPNSVLYQGKLSAMTAQVNELVKEIKKEPHSAINHKVSLMGMKAYQQLQKIANNLNYLGLSDNYFPIFRYKYLQAAAVYMSDQAIQTERTFINFRSTAENQKFERMQLQSNLELQQSALRIEQKRMEDAQLEVEYADAARLYAELRKQNASDTLDDWNTLGWELASVNAALAWAGNAANDQDIRYYGVQYHGKSHDYSGDVEDFYDTVGGVREEINWELQQNRLERQLAEADVEISLTIIRQQQANVRLEVQQMTVDMAQLRVEGAQELLDYAQDRMFDEDMWFKLAAELQDLSREYLDMAIYVAFLMERAYDLEFDRSLNRIRFDYGIGGVEGLLGGDYLKRDIDSFTIDYLQHAQKKNPVRLTISLREQFPAAFNQFLETGKLAFRTDLEIFDRLFPGTYRRKLKKLELFVEGLVPVEGATGFLTHLGVSTEWKQSGATWTKFNRVTPAEQMVLSSYQFRRDISVFQPSEQMLGLFENLGPQGNWTLELPRSSNNLDYNAISDIKIAFYFDADYSSGLREFLKTFYPATGGKSAIYSARFHFPDQYFRLDADKKLSFELHATRFAYNYTGLKIEGLGVRILKKDSTPVAAQAVKVIRLSDNTSVSAVTNANGLILGDATTMAPFDAWKGASPVDTFTVEFPSGTDTTTIGDVQFYLNYGFAYRADS